MEMRKIACAVLVAAASATAAMAAEAPAPGPASGSFAVPPAVGAVIGASVVSFFAFYLQEGLIGGLQQQIKGEIASINLSRLFFPGPVDISRSLPPVAMEMRKIACAVLVAAASATAAMAAEAPAPGPASGSFAVAPAVGAVIGASLLSIAFYLQ
ncbi:arabinogalactan protein 23-like [Canna indica]|uniref:Arabinogalactan protein 23-like n=1 Tax=Canna indica TaxID=4628 RepID=A0AAQ3KUP5_9LILI|nr:arabinogalactan protein 23-like [Canna indica]